MFENLQNFIRDGVSASIASDDTTISVPDASLFPDPTNGEYHLVLWNEDAYTLPSDDPDVEVVEVTGRDTTNNDLTVTRGVESTSAVSHPSTSVLQLAPTSALLRSPPLEVLASGSELPTDSNDNPSVTQPTIFYLNSEDDYVAPFQS